MPQCEFLALGLFAAKDEEVLERYLTETRAARTPGFRHEALELCEQELYYRGLGYRPAIGEFRLTPEAALQLQGIKDLREAGNPIKTAPKTCKTKRRFPSAELAQSFAAAHRYNQFPYQCNVCGEYHLSSINVEGQGE